VSGNVEELPAVPSFDNVQQRLSASPTLRRMQLEVERRRSLVDVERGKRIPDVTFSLGVKRPNELQRDQLLFGVSVPLPLFDRNQGNLLEALKREDKARDELQALNMRVSTDVLQARERLESIRGEVDVLQRDVLPGAKSAYDAATVGFENGKFNFLEVLDAQRTYFAAKSQYLKALAEAHRAAADIDRVLGESAPSATQPVNKE
jgi:cobalt-zinc-cadmium efflux system outer membrane protein